VASTSRLRSERGLRRIRLDPAARPPGAALAARPDRWNR